MTRLRGHRYVSLALVMFGLACGDATTAPNGSTETVRVSLVGLGGNDAGAVLQLVGAVSQVESAESMVDIAWAADGPSSATVVLVGPLSENQDVLIIRRPGGLDPLRAEVREVANAEGNVASSTSAQALVRAVTP